MDTRTLDWNWRGETIRVGADASGTGPRLLMLPALSSISSRREMHPLQQHLARHYSTLSVDWPGFGEGARPQLDWTPDTYAAFLAFLLTSVIAHPHAVITAGHAATYVLAHAAGAPDAMERLVLIAPTWRGARRLRSSCSTAPRRRRGRARRWRRLPPFPAFAPRGSPRANSPCTRSFPTRPSTPSSRSSPGTPPASR